jgi:hypothetical protein
MSADNYADCAAGLSGAGNEGHIAPSASPPAVAHMLAVVYH